MTPVEVGWRVVVSRWDSPNLMAFPAHDEDAVMTLRLREVL